MLQKAIGIVALAVLGGSAFAQTARAVPNHMEINEVLMNPDGGGGDINSGREFIEIYGPVSTSLNGYSVVVVENEEDGTTNSDRGRVKGIFNIPNGKSTDSNGLFIIRDNAGAADTTAGSPATFNPTDALGASNRWDLDFSTIVDDSPVRGNTLENEGCNIFLVTGVNANLVQKQEDASEDEVVAGTDLDTDDNGSLDYYEDSDGDRIINGLEGSPTGVALATDVVDFVFVGEASYETETDEGHSVSNKMEKNCNYILGFAPGGTCQFFGRNWTVILYICIKIIICDVQLGADNNSSWTPDLVARVADGVAVVADVVANSNAQDFDSSEKSFSRIILNRTSGTVPWDNVVGTLRATPGRVGQYSVRDIEGTNWTH